MAADYLTEKLVFGPRAIHLSFKAQLARFKDEAARHMRGAPVLIGEFGIPFDLQNKRAFRTGSYSAQIKAMDRSMAAMDANFLSATLWNYSPDNTNLRGDLWNDEDLSIFSRDQQTYPEDLNSGGRAIEAVVRPYPLATAGRPIALHFDLRRKTLLYSFTHDPAIPAPTEFFLPRFHYPRGIRVEAPLGRCERDEQNQRLRYYPTTPGGLHTIRIRPA